MAAFLDGCRFNPTAGGTIDWTYSSAVTGYQSPAAANVVNGRLYKYRAESSDLSQWELGEGAYNTSTGVLARTTVLYNSSGGTSKINFTTVPQVAVVALKEDLVSVEEANTFTAPQQLQARNNIGVYASIETASTDLNTIVTGGLFFIEASCTNLPIASTQFYLFVQKYPQSSGYVQQTAWDLTPSGGMWTRVQLAGSWSPWQLTLNTDALTLTGAQQAQVRANIGIGSLKNLIRNGTFDVWQRGTSPVAGLTAWVYTADGWMVDFSGALGTVTSIANSRSGAQTVNALQITGVTGVTGLLLAQNIESYVITRAGGQPLTFQAWITNNTGASITPLLEVQHASVQDNFGTVVTDISGASLQACPNGTATLVSYTFTPASGASNGLRVIVSFGAIGASQSVIIAEVDLQVTPGVPTGLNANPPVPEFRFIGFELEFCQRYYATSFGNLIAPGTATHNGMVFVMYDAGSTVTGYATTDFPAQMRAVPTMAYYDGAGNASKLSYLGNGGSVTFTNNGTPNGGTQFFAVGVTSFSFVGFVSSTVGNYFIHYTASSELL